MERNILQETLKKCKKAMLSGVPIVYIKTDSDIFIENLVMSEKNPLVVLVNNAMYIMDKEKKKNSEYRPIEEAPEAYRLAKNCINYKRNEVLDPANMSQVPYIGTYKMPLNLSPDNKAATDAVLKKLEKYVLAYKNTRREDSALLQSSLMILYSPEVHLTPMLRTYTEIIDLEYPNEEEIRSIIKSVMGNELEASIGGAQNLSGLCTDLLGFSSEDVNVIAQRILALSSIEEIVSEYGGKKNLIKNIVYKRKMQKLEGGLLELRKTDFDKGSHGGASDSIGGMKEFRAWLQKQKEPLTRSNDYKMKLGVNPPNGVLLCGIPGCGKSLAADFSSETLEMPLLKMDIGSLMDKYIGESERQMREALKMAEAMSPCVLFIDEIEKGFSGAASGDSGDGGTFKRAFGYMLGWMQDNTSPCFIFTTANDISGLPKEFFRSGRFDALYGVFLPTAQECADIFLKSMKKAEKIVAKKQGFADLFSGDCYDETIYLNVIDRCLAKKGRPRIIIGSDIQKTVDISLRELSERIFAGDCIHADEWERTITKTLNDPTFSTYGQGEENLNGIVSAYAGLLRKGFIPTSDKPMFKPSDYHPEVMDEIERLRKKINTASDREEALKLRQEMEEKKLISRCDLNQRGLRTQYDKEVYEYLYQRINYVIFEIEKQEREHIVSK